MISTLLMITLILFLALQLEDKFNIPSPLSLITLTFITHQLFHNTPVLTSNMHDFAALVIFLLPILLISDSLEMKLSELKAHCFSLLYLAGVSIVLSVLMALLISDWLFSGYGLNSAAVIVLFAMVLATDPVSVVSIFSRFELPHRLKILAEGESLLNDATALIVFMFIGLYTLDGGKVTATYITEVSSIVIFGSIAVGVVVGFAGLLVMKSTENRIAEMMLLILTGYGAFQLAEHFYMLLNLLGIDSHLHLSGILAVIVATITVNYILTQAVDKENQQIGEDEATLQQEANNRHSSPSVIDHMLNRIKATLEERERHLRTKEDVQLLALVANTLLFIAMAEMIDMQLMMQYKVEIIAMFLATTVIRALMIALLALISRGTNNMARINVRWWSVLTFAGIKGGLSIVMLTMIPASFPHLEMFKAVVIGVIMLSTFIYSAALLAIIGLNKDKFALEKQAEH